MSCQNYDEAISQPWYKKGLHFSCTGCGRCCSGPPGAVWVTDEEISALAELLSLTVDQFKRDYVREIDGRLSLIEKETAGGEFDCVFLEDKKCRVYEKRPLQCRTFPWWKQNLASQESWKRVSMECEGISTDAPKVSYEEIKKNLDSMSKR